MGRPIAVFDSGVGGITVLHRALQMLPREDYIYYADIANVPYGTKSLDQVKKLLSEACEQIMQHDPKAIVIACNTATSAGISDLREQYDIPIVGMEPAVRPALSQSDKRVLVMATELTLSLSKYTELVKKLDNEDRIDSLPMPILVEAAENFDFTSVELRKCLKDKLKDIDWTQYDAIVLGCTHFVYFYPILRKILPAHISIVDGNLGTVTRLQSLITPTPSDDKAQVKVMLSGQEVDAELIEPYMTYLDHFAPIISPQS